MKEIFGDNLSYWLRSGGRKQNWFASKMGVDPSLVNRWKQGDCLPKSNNLELLPKVTGLPLFIFFIDHGVAMGKTALEQALKDLPKV